MFNSAKQNDDSDKKHIDIYISDNNKCLYFSLSFYSFKKCVYNRLFLLIPINQSINSMKICFGCDKLNGFVNHLVRFL